MFTVAATIGPSLCVMTELDNKVTNKNIINTIYNMDGIETLPSPFYHDIIIIEGRGNPSTINTTIDIAVNASA